MAGYRFIILDAYPLGNAAVAAARPGVMPTDSQQCRQWMIDCELAGSTLLVPAIAYYEEVREMEQRQASGQIARLQNFCFDPVRFVPLTTSHLTEAAKLWGQVRRDGQPTSDRFALDGDVILAAQVLSLGLPNDQYIVATRNAKHLIRFGLPADEWQKITP
jgi:predicted nucleic acid-binding protein